MWPRRYNPTRPKVAAALQPHKTQRGHGATTPRDPTWPLRYNPQDPMWPRRYNPMRTNVATALQPHETQRSPTPLLGYFRWFWFWWCGGQIHQHTFIQNRSVSAKIMLSLKEQRLQVQVPSRPSRFPWNVLDYILTPDHI